MEQNTSRDQSDTRDVEVKLDAVLRYSGENDDAIRNRIRSLEDQQARHTLVQATGVSRQDVAQKMHGYRAMSQSLGQANESMSANEYIISMLHQELLRVGRINTEARNLVRKHHNTHMGVVFSTHYYDMITDIVLLTLLETCVLFLIATAKTQSLLSRDTGIVVALMSVIVFFIVLSIMVGNTTMRRRNHWSHYYWQTSAGVAVDGSKED